MPVLETLIDRRSAAFQANDAAMTEIVADLRRVADTTCEGGGKASRDRHVSRGKLLPRVGYRR